MMNKVNFLWILVMMSTLFISSCSKEELETDEEQFSTKRITRTACTPPTYIAIRQLTIADACPGNIFTFEAESNGSTDIGSYQWSAFDSASIVSGQGTKQIRVQSPSSGGFSISVEHINSCENKSISGFTFAQFVSNCGGFGF